MFIEFLFEILHEKDEPLICMVELVKAALKLREYYQLIHRERVNSYLELDSYRELTLLKEIKENHIKMMRTKKRIERIKGFQVDNNLHALKYDSGVQNTLENYEKNVLNELGVDLNQNGHPSQNNKNLKKGKEPNKIDSLSLIVEKQDEEQSENSTNSGD